MFDMKNSRIGHVFQPSISSLIKLFKLVDHGCPFKIQEVHIMNTAPFISFILGKEIFNQSQPETLNSLFFLRSIDKTNYSVRHFESSLLSLA